MGLRGKVALTLALAAVGCGKGDAPALSKAASMAITAPSPQGPKLGAAAVGVPVFERPGAPEPLGHLRLGGAVARSERPVSQEGCAGGWFAVYPRGVVCLDQGATLDPKHPAMAAPAPTMDAPLPYGYARTRARAPVLELTAGGAKPAGELMPRAGVAVLGATRVAGPGGKIMNVSVLTDGRVIESSALEPAREVTFQGAALSEERGLPIAYVVKDGVTPIKLQAGKVEPQGEIERGRVAITGKFHTRSNERYWALDDGSYIRNRDLTVITKRDKFPDFVQENTRWVDVSVIACTLVAYEGRKAVYATVIDTGVNRTGGTNSTTLGTFPITSKYVTAPPGSGPFDPQAEIRDVPWAMKLGSGQMLGAAYWVPRFGILHGTGHLLLSPADARWLWTWVGGEVPEGWLGAEIPADKRVTVLVRK